MLANGVCAGTCVTFDVMTFGHDYFFDRRPRLRRKKYEAIDIIDIGKIYARRHIHRYIRLRQSLVAH